MSSNDNQEEFAILLEMGKQEEFKGYLSPKIKLFNMWAKRVPLSERAQIFKSTPARAWKQLNYPANIWAFEQKILAPDSIDCPIETLWPLDMYTPDGVPNLVVARLNILMQQPTISAKSVVDFIVGVEENSNNWLLCVKDTQALTKLNEIVAMTSAKSAVLGNAIINAFPPQLGKKLSQLNSNVSDAHTAVAQLLQALNKSTPIESSMQALSKLDPSSVLVNDDLTRKIKRHFSDNTFKYFKTHTDVLLNGKWGNKDIAKLCPNFTTYTTIKMMQDFLPFWMANPSTVKDIKETCETKVLEVLGSPSTEIEKSIKWFQTLRNAGITQEHFNKWLGIQTYSDFWDGLIEVMKTPVKVATSVEKNQATMVGVLPNQMMGTLLVFKHLADGAPLDTRFCALKASSVEDAENELELCYSLSSRETKKLKMLGENFKCAVDKVNIASSVTPSSKVKSRKM